MVEEHLFTLNDHQVRYYEAGLHHSRSVLLLHGGIGDARLNWYEIMPHLAEDYHVLAPDLPGFGDSDSLPANTDLSDMSAWAMDFLESQDVTQAAVIGSSFGALIARLMAVQNPHTVVAVVLINGGFVPDVPTAFRILMRLPVVGGLLTRSLAKMAVSPDSLSDMFYHEEMLTPELVANIESNVPGFASLMRMTASKPLPPETTPMVSVLIIWGLEDQSTSRAEGNKLKEALGATFIEIEDCGHLPHLEEPDIFDWQVKNFLAKQDPTKRTSIPGT